MIAVSEPLEFIPRGRQAVEEHPGPVGAMYNNANMSASENLLMHRMQNVNISSDERSRLFNEHWIITNIYKGSDYMMEFEVNSEQELYFKGHTAVWSRGVGSETGVLPRTCFTCDTPIRHAFFCTSNFVPSDDGPNPINDGSSLKTAHGICLIDSSALRVYLNSGEDFLASLEFPVSDTWPSNFGILLQKNASTTTVNSQSIAMPRLFSLAHPLDEMCPVLIRPMHGTVSYLTDTDYVVVFVSTDCDLILMYDHKTCKHFISRLRKATEKEATDICPVNDTLNPEMASHIDLTQSGSLLKGIGSIGLKQSNLLQNKQSFITAFNRTQSLFSSQKPSNLSEQLLQNASTANSIHNRTCLSHTPRDRLQMTFGTATINGALMSSRMSHVFTDLRKDGQAMPPKPIAPKLCLEEIWAEPSEPKEYAEVASHGFVHTDLVGQSYLCYMLSRSAKLQLISLNCSMSMVKNNNSLSFIDARDAVGLTEMHMLVVLAPCGTICLYSGSTMIGKIHVGGVLSSFANLSTSFGASFPRRSSLLPSISSDTKFDDELHTLSPVHPLQPQIPSRNSGFCCGLRDACGNRLTLIYPGGQMYRIAVPFFCDCPFVSKCFAALRAVLKKEQALQLIIKWYGVRNAPGTHDLNASQEWSMFCSVLLEMIGRPFNISNHGNSNISSTSNTSDEPKKRRKNENCVGTDDDWYFLQQHVSGQCSDGTNIADPPSTARITSPRNNYNAPLFAYIPLVFQALHLLYEDLKLDMNMQLHLASMAELLYQLAMDLQLECFCLHYFLDYPHLVYNQSGTLINEEETKRLLNQELLAGQVPSIFKFINSLIENRTLCHSYPNMPGVNDLSKSVILLIHLLSTGIQLTYINDDCIQIMQTQCSPLDLTKYDSYQPDDTKKSISKRFVAAFLNMRLTRQHLERFPIALQYLFAESLEGSRLDPPIERNGSDVCHLLLRPDLLAHLNFEHYEAVKYLPNQTFRNVQKEHSLSPKIPTTPDVIPKSDVVPSEDGMEQLNTKLLQLRFPDDLRIMEVRRLLSSSTPVPIDIMQSLGVSDHDFIEEQEKHLFAICTRTMALPLGRGMFTLRTCTPVSTESMTIPKLCLTGRETSKGATVELQQIEVPPNMNQWPLFHNGVAAGLQVTPDARDIDSTWIVYNKPKVAQQEISAEHGGFLMALGLNGHLKKLSFMSIYEYLVKSEEMTSVGLLLGIAAAHRGTMDVTTTKLLSVHIEALLPATALELDIPQNIQVAAILGIGLVYQGTAKRHMAEVLLQEIGRPPGPEMDNCIERESYALTAGLALGLVTLGQGESSTGLRDLQLPDTLHYYMIGGKKRALSGSQKDKYKLPSFQVREGDTVNIDVTAPGATLALGLMFFGTGNKAVANWMKPPETTYLLDLVRPDLLLLRIIARGLILWDDIQPTDEWLFGQFPKPLAFDLKLGPVDDDIDHEANCQAYCNIITGAAFCLGLRFAGTENATVLDKLKQILDLFLNINGKYIGDYAGKATIESCLVLVLISASLVFAGTGNLYIMRMCRMLRARLGSASYSQVTYGSHLAIHMALGFLFLGAGRFTLRRTPEAIAALVCTLFPKFPSHSHDNRYHLQAFRHLYVLAVEPRLFLPRDIDSGKLCLCRLSFERLDDGVVVTPMAPCILPELETLRKVDVIDANYWPICFERGKNWDLLQKILAKCGCIDIKQKAGCLSHLDDPDRLKSLLAQTLTTEQYLNWMIDAKSPLSFSHDEGVHNFTRKFMAGSAIHEKSAHFNMLSKTISGNEIQFEQIIRIQFYSCLTKDRMHMLPIYMNLLLIMQRIENCPANNDVWQLKILSTLHGRSLPHMQVLSSEILGSVLDRLREQMFQYLHIYRNILQKFLFSSSCAYLQEVEVDTLDRVASVICFYDVPINVMNCIDVSGVAHCNHIRLLMQCYQMGLKSHTIQCISRCLSP